MTTRLILIVVEESSTFYSRCDDKCVHSAVTVGDGEASCLFVGTITILSF